MITCTLVNELAMPPILYGARGVAMVAEALPVLEWGGEREHNTRAVTPMFGFSYIHLTCGDHRVTGATSESLSADAGEEGGQTKSAQRGCHAHSACPCIFICVPAKGLAH